MNIASRLRRAEQKTKARHHIGHPFPVFRELARLVPRPLLEEIGAAGRDMDSRETKA